MTHLASFCLSQERIFAHLILCSSSSLCYFILLFFFYQLSIFEMQLSNGWNINWNLQRKESWLQLISFLLLSIVIISSSAVRNFFCLLLSPPFTAKRPGDVGLHIISLPPGVVPPKTSTCGPPFPSPAPRSDLFSVFPPSEWEALSGGDFHRLCCRPLPSDSLLWQGFRGSQMFLSLPVINWSL